MRLDAGHPGGDFLEKGIAFGGVFFMVPWTFALLRWGVAPPGCFG
jgi:hypothetical protein